MRSSEFLKGVFEAIEEQASEMAGTRELFQNYIASDLRKAISQKVADDRMVEAIASQFSSVFFEIEQRRHDELIQLSKIATLAHVIEDLSIKEVFYE